MTVVSVLVALLLLGILITVHEFGHYIFARMTGIEVMEFAIGFGPKIVGWTGKSGTKFALRCIPLGGYCAFYGEDDVEGKATNDPRAFGKLCAHGGHCLFCGHLHGAGLCGAGAVFLDWRRDGHGSPRRGRGAGRPSVHRGASGRRYYP